MAIVFISHSSKDKPFAKRLATDLADRGHTVWLDEWIIKIGECIVTKIERGISDADYVIIILSQNSVISEWVEREWKAKYWDEISKGQNLVLPLLIEDCHIPPLLKTKKYADFRTNYDVGFDAILSALSEKKGAYPFSSAERIVLRDISGIDGYTYSCNWSEGMFGGFSDKELSRALRQLYEKGLVSIEELYSGEWDERESKYIARITEKGKKMAGSFLDEE